MLNKEDFFELHCHYDYSNQRMRDSTNKINESIEYINSLGQNGLAITDHETVSGHIKFLQTIKESKKNKTLPQDFKGILGNEIYLVDEEQMKLEVENYEKINLYHFLLLSKNKIGHQQLCELSSKAWKRMFNYKGVERVPTYYDDMEEILGANKNNIIGLTACLGGYFPKLVLSLLNEVDDYEKEQIKDKLDDFINWCLNIFGEDNFYIEIQPSRQEEQIEFNKMAIAIAKAYGIKWVVTTDSHYLNKEQREIHKAFLTSEDDTNNNREVDAFYSTTRFFEIEELYDYLDYLDIEDIEKAILNTKEIANKIEEYDLSEEIKVPNVKLPEHEDWFKLNNDELKEIENHKSIAELFHSDEIYHRYFIYQIFRGIEERQIISKEMKDTLARVDLECFEIIGASKAKHQPMGSYLITMQKNVELIWEEAKSLVGAGRGSANGYITNYLLGITQVNPLKQGVEMPHWRFMSAERPDIFDIDIDYSSHKRDIVFDTLLKYYKSIGGDLVRSCTFGTETSKSAIQTACRGLKINNDVGTYLSSLIPVDRGAVWKLKECYYGDEEKGKQPIAEFKRIVDEYSDKNLLKVSLGIEGLINKRSSHACGIFIVNEAFTKHNAFMRTPSGELVSQFDLHDSEYVSNLKYDFLNTKTMSMVQITLEMLVSNNKIEWQGTLRKTYNKYLHPDIIEYKDKKMWDILCKGELLSAFQFESQVGEQAIKLIQPQSLIDTANGNTVMRLMVDSGEQPLEKFVRYKNNIQEWYTDMKQFGLSDKQVKIIEKHLLQDNGVCSSQERMMLLTMDKEISGFGVIESNMLRKGCAKKKKEIIESSKQLFFEWGHKLGTPQILLDYIWDEQIRMQLGYGFSILHSVAYTIILIQQLNLVFKYPPIYWNTAVLLVESGALDREIAEDGEGDTKEKTTNYGEVAKAIGKLQSKNVKISLPDINEAEQGFLPNEKDNAIVFGFKGIMSLNNETAKIIIENRPFINLSDFHKRMVEVKREVILKTGKKQMKSLVSSTQTITLIKSGAFDNIENKSREEILEGYVRLLNPPKNKLNTKDIAKISELGILPSEYKDMMRFYNFREYIMKLPKKQDKDIKSIEWLEIKCGEDTEYTTNFFLENFSDDMEEEKDYKFDENGILKIVVKTKRKGSFEDIYSNKINPIVDWLSTEECKNYYNAINFENTKRELMGGNISSWEMESMNYYYHEHELLQANLSKYNIIDFNELSSEPQVIGFSPYKGLQYPKFDIYNIVGTVLDRDKNKHLITILTPTGVVQVKFYSGQFGFYDKPISIDNGNDEKTGKAKKITLEDGWFKRGNKLLITGYRRGEQFKPKRYKNTIYQHTVQLIKEIKENGDLILQGERVNIND